MHWCVSRGSTPARIPLTPSPPPTLTEVHWNSTLVQENAVEEVRALKSDGDGMMEIGGANLAASVMPYGLIDEYQLFVSPVVLGGGTPMFPPLDRARQETEIG